MSLENAFEDRHRTVLADLFSHLQVGLNECVGLLQVRALESRETEEVDGGVAGNQLFVCRSEPRFGDVKGLALVVSLILQVVPVGRLLDRLL